MKSFLTSSLIALLALSTACVVGEEPVDSLSLRAGACQPADCGPPLGQVTCEDGSLGGPSECVELEDGTCAWAVAACDGVSASPLYFATSVDGNTVDVSTFTDEGSTSARYCGPRNCWAMCATCLYRDCIDSGYSYSVCAQLRESCKADCPRLDECPYSDPFCDFDLRR